MKKKIEKKYAKMIQYDYDMVECLRQHVINIINSDGFIYSTGSVKYAYSVLKKHCKLFVENMCEVLEIDKNELKEFDIDFETAEATFSLKKENIGFDIEKFSIGTLNLNDEYEKKLIEILKEEN